MPVGRGGRPRYRPPIGIPSAVAEPTWKGTAASVALHALIIALILAPLAAPAVFPEILNQGAGGPGPAGGGGGGRRGTGGESIEERVNYVRPAAPAAPDPTRLQPPVEEKKPDPVTPPTPPAPAVDIKTDVKVPDIAATVSAVRGTGGGTGSDGTNGSGPGSGGGVGSGVGTGRGTGEGPGTGGGPGTIYKPSPVNVVVPPMGLAQRFCPYAPKAYFDVDEKGGTTLVALQPPSRDRDFQKKMLAALRDYRFRPATRLDGTPVRDTAEVELIIC
jgi:hypothetical protein